MNLFEWEVWIPRGWNVGRCRLLKRRSLVEPDFQQLSSSYSCLRLRRVDSLLARAVDWSHRLCLWFVFHSLSSIVPL